MVELVELKNRMIKKKILTCFVSLIIQRGSVPWNIPTLTQIMSTSQIHRYIYTLTQIISTSQIHRYIYTLPQIISTSQIHVQLKGKSQFQFPFVCVVNCKKYELIKRSEREPNMEPPNRHRKGAAHHLGIFIFLYFLCI